MGFWLWGLGSHLCSTIVGSAEEEIATVRVPDRGHLEHVPSQVSVEDDTTSALSAAPLHRHP
jgi:hypothetical protein